MSMYWSGSRVLGLLIKEQKAIESFKENYVRLNPNDFRGVDDPEEAMEEALVCCEDFVFGCDAGKDISAEETKKFSAQYYDDSVFEGCFIAPSDPESTDVKRIYDFPFIFVYASLDISSRSHFKQGFYSSYEELVAEMKEKVQAYLPEDFDWKSNIGDLMYAAFC